MNGTKELCPICGEVTILIKFKDDSQVVDCPRCGRFEITETALVMFQKSVEKDKVLSVSFWLRNNQSKDIKRIVTLNAMKLRDLLVTFIPLSPIEQVNNFLIWLGENLKSISDQVIIPLPCLISIMGCYNLSDVHLIIDHIFSEKYINKIYESIQYSDIRTFRGGLTFKGWEKYYELQRINVESRLVFMAMKYDQEPLETLFKDVIKPAVDETGFEIRKLTEEKRAGLIDDKLRVEIRRSKFLIADLTHDNNGAYWEAGYAEGLGMPVIYICEKEKFEGQKSHFDTNHHLTVQWDKNPEKWEEFVEELKATIRATFPAEAKMED